MQRDSFSVWIQRAKRERTLDFGFQAILIPKSEVATKAMSSTKASAKKRALNSDVSKSGKKLRVEEDDLFDPDLSRFVFLSLFPFLFFYFFIF